MTRTQSNLGAFWMALTVAFALTALVVFGATAANAGCPADQVTTADGQKNASKGTKDGTDELLGQIDLSKEQVKVPGRLLRFRRLVIEPGGEVPWHNHADRPALIYVVSEVAHDEGQAGPHLARRDRHRFVLVRPFIR
jgi:hypothetical protein